jgi:hypothetical protein
MDEHYEPESFSVDEGIEMTPASRGHRAAIYPWRSLVPELSGRGNSFFVEGVNSTKFASSANAAGKRMGAMFIVRNATKEIREGNSTRVVSGVRVWRIK